MSGTYNGTAFGDGGGWFNQVTNRSQDMIDRYHANHPGGLGEGGTRRGMRERRDAARRLRAGTPAAGPAVRRAAGPQPRGPASGPPGRAPTEPVKATTPVVTREVSRPGNVPTAGGSGPGLGIVTTGSGFAGGGPGVGGLLTGITDPADPVFIMPDTDIGLSKGQDTRTPYTMFGVTMQPSPWFGDAQYTENRLGDDGPLIWANQLAIGVADGANTLDIALGRPRASINWPMVGFTPAKGNKGDRRR